MKVTYLDHSGFCVELEHTVLIFDFVEGILPDFDMKKAIYFFVSHRHQDHYHKQFGKLLRNYPNANAVLSNDIRNVHLTRATYLGPGEACFLDDIHITTFRSTDEGVAFLVKAEQRTIYHAGDLHWWCWEDDTPQEAKIMKEAYLTEIEKLRNVPIDLAFLVLDPRLGSEYWMGFDAFMRINQAACAIPMHCWGDYEIMDRMKKHHGSESYRDRILVYSHRGETIQIGGN